MKQETLKDTAKKFTENLYYKVGDADEFNGEPLAVYDAFIDGAKWQAERMYSDEPKPTIKQVDYVAKKQERMYSEEDMRKAYDQGIDDSFDIGFSSKDDTNFNVFIKQFKNK
jgi:hypothetical protein